jgi:putative peptidoglycan lipid II flippase
MFNRIFNSKSKTVTFAAFILAVSALISRVLGLIRDRLLASGFGAGEELDIYFAAFRIPDFVYGILIVGGITATFLPVFSEYFKEGKGSASADLDKDRVKTNQNEWNKQGLEFISNVLNCFFILLVLICGILAILTPLIVKFIIPGFSEQNLELTIQLTRIMFLSPVLFGLSSIFSGILHYFNRFFAYALAPIFYNLGIIFGILFLVPIYGIFGLIFGVILGALLHLLIQIPAVFNTGFRYKFILNFRSYGIIKIFRLMLPRTIGTAAYQINLIVITAIASTLTVGSITIFNFSNNLYYFPIGLIGVSFAISAFPVFSKFLVNGQKKEFLENFSASFRQILFFIVPISFLIFLLRAQIVRLILGAGEFGWLETRLTAASLGVFCFGIIAGSLTPLLNRVFFALQNTKTPVIIGIISMVANVFFCFIFIYFLSFPNIFQNLLEQALRLKGIENIQVIGLPLALSLSIFLQAVLLLIFLYKKIGNFKIKEILFSLSKILIASVLMIITVYFVREIVNRFVDMQTFIGVFWQALLSSLAGISIYLLVSLFLKSPEIKIIKLSFFRQFNK